MRACAHTHTLSNLSSDTYQTLDDSALLVEHYLSNCQNAANTNTVSLSKSLPFPFHLLLSGLLSSCRTVSFGGSMFLIRATTLSCPKWQEEVERAWDGERNTQPDLSRWEKYSGLDGCTWQKHPSHYQIKTQNKKLYNAERHIFILVYNNSMYFFFYICNVLYITINTLV